MREENYNPYTQDTSTLSPRIYYYAIKAQYEIQPINN